jgi:hypothetical protein
MRPEDLTPETLAELRADGAELADMEAGMLGAERRYVILAYELFPNGTTSEGFVEDPEVGKAIGERLGIGPPTDSLGWAIWEVPHSDPR